MDEANTRMHPAHDLLNLLASAPVGTPRVPSFHALDLTGARFAETSQYTIARGEEYAPGMPRTRYGALQYDFR
jgi:hypothetical protein